MNAAALTFPDLITRLTADTLGSLAPFAPELCVVATILSLLLVRLLGLDRWLPGGLVAVAGTVVALGLSIWQFGWFNDAVDVSRPLFTQLLTYDPFTVFFRIFLLLFLLFVIWLTLLTGIPDAEDAPDFYTLLLGSTLGMLLMVSANNLLMMFLAIEMTSVPSYAMAGFLKGRKTSSEAALKYVIYGAGAAGVMLYGLSLLAGILGTAQLPEMAVGLSQVVSGGASFSQPEFRTLVLGLLMVLVGIAFKLSLFPFHFWCPDVFEGAAAEVAGFLSVASKGAAFALLIRFLLAFSGGAQAPLAASHPLYMHLGLALSLVAVVTTTFGNLAAYAQTNIKRLLAYSTIAHAGYMLMAVGAMMVLLNGPAGAMYSGNTRIEAAADAIQGLLYYLVVYFFMNLGVFAIVAFVRNASFGPQRTGEDLADYRGLVKQSPLLAICLLICVFSLIGLPPFGGFWGKFMVFYSVLAAAKAHWVMWLVLVAGLFNTAFSLYYYLKVLKVAFIEERPTEARDVELAPSLDVSCYALAVTIPVVLLGLAVDPLSRVAREVASWLLQA
ncbi:MAG: NADH-quinone oxidoreductase subunit N [Planctomycetaceae bacterium]|jgi:NADH-quinone oxidoreductase subunit N